MSKIRLNFLINNGATFNKARFMLYIVFLTIPTTNLKIYVIAVIIIYTLVR